MYFIGPGEKKFHILAALEILFLQIRNKADLTLPNQFSFPYINPARSTPHPQFLTK